MSSRVNWHFRQRVQENELDFAFDQLEQADRDLASDLNIYGIVSGAVATPHQPVADLRVDVTGPSRAYDRLGRRIFVPVQTTVDLERDVSGLPTAVTTPGNERWISLFMRFNRVLSDPRIDGGGQQVFFRRDESFEFIARQGPEAAGNAASRPPLEPDELLICDVLRAHGQTQIEAHHIDVTRRQRFVFAHGENIGVLGSDWTVIDAHAADVQAAFNSLDRELRDHVDGESRRHGAGDIEVRPQGFLTSSHVQGALNEIVDTLASFAGATHVGADPVDGSPFALSAGTVDSQLSQLNSHLNSHAKSTTAHNASSIPASTHSNIASTNVQGQLEEIVADLAAQGGAQRVGAAAVSGSPTSLPSGTVRDQLSSLLAALNTHQAASSGAHPASSVSIADDNNRLNAQTVEGAIGETLEALEGDHFRVNQPNPGQHRTIRQPALATSGFALLWDAKGNGGARFRAYMDNLGLWLTINAATSNGQQWTKDVAEDSTALRLFHSLTVMHHLGQPGELSFSSWQKTYKLPMGQLTNTAGWSAEGSVQEVGRVGFEALNTHTASRQVAMGTSVTFRTKMVNGPTSVTLTTIDQTNVPTLPEVQRLDDLGFHVQSIPTVNANTHARWLGKYTTVP